MKYNINDLKIIVNDKILDDIRKYYCLNTNYETGGILLGKFNKENRVVEITEVHELKTNFFSRILYKRSGRKAQKIINRRWHETNGVINYIGEWHTHRKRLIFRYDRKNPRLLFSSRSTLTVHI